MKSELQLRLAKNLKELRKEHKLTQFELAEKANISEAMIKSIELALSWPSDKTLINLSKALEIDTVRFFIPIDIEKNEQEKFYTDLELVVRKNFDKYLDNILLRLKNKLPG